MRYLNRGSKILTSGTCAAEAIASSVTAARSVPSAIATTGTKTSTALAISQGQIELKDPEIDDENGRKQHVERMMQGRCGMLFGARTLRLKKVEKMVREGS